MQEEIWKDIPNYESLYQVSSLGRVKSKERPYINYKGDYCIRKERILIPFLDTNKYLNVKLCSNCIDKTRKIHKLVAEAFLNHKPDGTHKIVVDHIDNVKTNNSLNNLQLISQHLNSSKDKKRKFDLPTNVYLRGVKYYVKFVINKQEKSFGVFNNIIDAEKKAIEIRLKYNL